MIKLLTTMPPQIKLLLLVFVLVVIVFVSFALSRPSQPVPNITGSPSSSLPPAINPQENTFPEAIPQNFFNQDQEGAGSLVVESDPSGARVIIDTAEEEASASSQVRPVNNTPFTISRIPPGAHTATAFLEGYNLTSQDFFIKNGEITRIKIKLSPLEGRIGY